MNLFAQIIKCSKFCQRTLEKKTWEGHFLYQFKLCLRNDQTLPSLFTISSSFVDRRIPPNLAPLNVDIRILNWASNDFCWIISRTYFQQRCFDIIRPSSLLYKLFSEIDKNCKEKTINNNFVEAMRRERYRSDAFTMCIYCLDFRQFEKLSFSLFCSLVCLPLRCLENIAIGTHDVIQWIEIFLHFSVQNLGHTLFSNWNDWIRGVGRGRGCLNDINCWLKANKQNKRYSILFLRSGCVYFVEQNPETMASLHKIITNNIYWQAFLL